MAHSLSAEKRMRQNAKRRGANRRRKDQIKTLLKGFEASVHDGKKDEAAVQLNGLYKKLDQVAAKGTLHKKTVSRKKSRLAKRLNKLAK